MIAQHGYNAVTIRTVAEQAGLSKTGVVHHFASKQELLTEALARRDEWGADETGLDEPATFFDRLRESLVGDVAARGLIELYVRLLAESAQPGTAAHDFFTLRYKGADERGVAIWRQLQDAGRCPQGIDAHLLSVILMSLLDGLQMRLLYDPSIDITSVIDALQILVEGAAEAEFVRDVSPASRA
ncbi:TetR/AcrR family transcriptional regulator [Nocardioides marmoriginsengisoli]|uniref:TetR/AcrR family transcriptional regulator n=2 Tax=Nocardioides marmoriginsengisoli TaxID=661483 RepID=A0A3N0CHC6_9ACTN|nr:TetR/AcrR family transcriptional regulator [Nocardioides marmoriginsengisoli]